MTVGVAAKLIDQGVLDQEAETVVINSGDGLKTLDAIAEKVGPKTTIPARYEAFTDFWKVIREALTIRRNLARGVYGTRILPPARIASCRS